MTDLAFLDQRCVEDVEKDLVIENYHFAGNKSEGIQERRVHVREEQRRGGGAAKNKSVRNSVI